MKRGLEPFARLFTHVADDLRVAVAAAHAEAAEAGAVDDGDQPQRGVLVQGELGGHGQRRVRVLAGQVAHADHAGSRVRVAPIAGRRDGHGARGAMEQAIADAAGKDAAGRSAVRGAEHDQVGALRLGQVVQPACRRVGRDRALLDGANARDCLAGLGEAALRLGARGLLMGVATRCRVDGGEKDRAAGLAGEHARQGKPISAALAAVDADDDLREHGGKATRAPRARPSGPPAMPLRSFPQLRRS